MKELAEILDRAEEVLGLTAPDLLLLSSSTHHSAATSESDDTARRSNSLQYTYQEDDTWDEFCEDLPLE